MYVLLLTGVVGPLFHPVDIIFLPVSFQKPTDGENFMKCVIGVYSTNCGVREFFGSALV